MIDVVICSALFLALHGRNEEVSRAITVSRMIYGETWPAYERL